MKKNYCLSIIIPVYNEEKRIVNTISEIAKYLALKPVEYELIIVDDGSRDNSSTLINNLIKNSKLNIIYLKNMKNMGKGFSVKKGVLSAKGDIILFTDADLSVPIEEYEKLENAILEEKYDIAFGSRGLKESKKIIPQGFIRDRLGKLFGILVKFMLLPDINDPQCGFKAFKKEAAHSLFYWQTIHKFGFDPEILYLAKKHNFRHKEIPVIWKNNFDSKLNVMTDTFNIGFELLKIKIKSLLGHYSESSA